MKLSPKPKPVRIRISLGGIEHTTLESLKENITPEILNFTDGRLQRWLTQQGEKELSNYINAIKESKYNNDEEMLLTIYNELFNAKHKHLLNFVNDWKKSDKRAKKLLRHIISNSAIDKNALTEIFKHCKEFLPLREWYGKVSEDIFNETITKGLNIDNVDDRSTLCENLKDEGFSISEIDKIKQSLGLTSFGKRILFEYTSNDILQKVVEDWRYIKKISRTIETTKQNKDLEDNVITFINYCTDLFSKSMIWPCKEFPTYRDLDSYLNKNFPINYYKDDRLLNEKICIRTLAIKYHNIKRDYNLPVSFGEKHFNTVQSNYKFKNDIENVRSRFKIINIVDKIIEYILLEKFKE